MWIKGVGQVIWKRMLEGKDGRPGRLNVAVLVDGLRLAGFFDVGSDMAGVEVGDYVEIEGSVVGREGYINFSDVKSVQRLRLVPVGEGKSGRS